jgi:spore coat protein H
VAIHLKGAAGSFRHFDDKPGLTLNMDKFVDDQKFHGLDKFHLANSVQDPSFIQELFCGELFRAAGVPAARCSHAIVTLNGRARGFFYLKEGYDSMFIERNFGHKVGNFYDGGFLQDIDARLQVISNKDDVKDQADLNALLAASRVADSAERFKAMEKLMEMDKFISYVAVDMFLADWDGYPSKCNNYRVYHNPKTNKITFIPSGMDQMLGDPNWPMMMQFGGRIARKVIDTPEGKKRYAARTEELLKTVFKVDDMVKRLDELEKRVQPALAKADPGAARDHRHHVNRLKEAVKQRHRAVTEQLKGLK